MNTKSSMCIKVFCAVIILLLIATAHSTNSYVEALKENYVLSYSSFGSLLPITQKYDLENASEQNVNDTLSLVKSQLLMAECSFKNLISVVNNSDSGLKEYFLYIKTNLVESIQTKDYKKFEHIKWYIKQVYFNFNTYRQLFEDSLNGRVEKLPIVSKMQFNKVYNRLLNSLSRIKKDY